MVSVQRAEERVRERERERQGCTIQNLKCSNVP